MWNPESRRLVGGAIAFLVLMTFPILLWAAVAPISLKELVACSDVIVLARVLKVEEGPTDIKAEDDRLPAVKTATAEVIETWTGSPVREVRYVASPLWTCDVAHAEKGERVVLFLGSRRSSGIRIIAHSGRGRMPLREVEGKTYATLWSGDVRLPQGTATIPGPEPKYSFIRSVELNRLKELVRDCSR